ncbi:protein tyrosine phosphatase domain-containing protein 1-like [Tubulanus polymorphus]|uniref:protein tyrosine phosphatase domain-containing protein 1-like n=1 Tax=Tubulanus polymorphus TaxID=672921 RepID=UPI003DA224B1
MSYVDINSYVLEDIDWESDGVKAVLAKKKPKAKYGKLSEKLRKNIPEETLCAMFCGGKTCKYCDPPGYYTDEQMTIKGLYSSWVTENILAMSRPSTRLMKEYDIIKQFKEAGISSIINLQTPGEHFNCGDPLELSGFSYNIEDFMDEGIFFYNFGWPDYGVANPDTLLDMVRVMQFAVSEGKVAIHCHAGLGRTGVLIAVYLIFNNRMSAGEAIQYIRTKRKGAIQTKRQIDAIKAYGIYLKPFRIIYSDCATDDFTLYQYLMRQKHMLHGFEARRLKHIPKIIYVCCERLLELAHRGRRLKSHANDSDTLKLIREVAPKAFNNSPSSGATMMNGLKRAQSCDDKLSSADSDNNSLLPLPTATGRAGSTNDIYKLSANLTLNDESDTGSSFGDDKNTDEDGLRTDDDGDESSDPESAGIESVIRSLVTVNHTDDVKQIVHDYKISLNTCDSAWQTLSHENNPSVLSLLIWDWLDQLREPIISFQDLNLISAHVDEPLAGIQRLERASQHTTEYLVNFVTRLLPLDEEHEDSIMMRLMSVLTQQNVYGNRGDAFHCPSLTKSSRVMKSEMQQKTIKFFYLLLDALETKLQQRKMKRRASLSETNQ